MASTHLNHTDFKEEDIIKDGIVNEENLNTLCSQIEELSCYDKVGPEFYNISNTMAFSTKNRNPNFVLGWLRHLETLPSTSETVGYLGRQK